MGGCCGSDSDSRKRIGSYLSGFIFGLAWWLFIDAAAISSHDDYSVKVNFVKYLPGIGTTLALVLINSMDWEALAADSMTYHGDNVACKARSFVVFCLLLSLGSLSGAIVILAKEYVDSADENLSIYPGVAIFLQAILIFLTTFVMKLFTANV